MPRKIYSSSFPAVAIPDQSIFTRLFSVEKDLVGGHPASQPAFIDAATGAAITRAHLRHLALSFGHGLRSIFGVKRGDTLLVYAPNSIHWPVIIFGAVAAGLKSTLANNAYNARELAYQYTDSKANLIFTSEEGIPVVRQTLSDLGFSKKEADKRIVVLNSSLKWAGGPDGPKPADVAGLISFEDLLNTGVLPAEEQFNGNNANETAYLCYSSGTTGKPKGVETTHKNIVSVVEIVAEVFPPFGLDDKVLAVLPFYHIYGAVKLLHFPLTRGSPVVVMPRFDPVQFCANIEKYKIALALIVPPVLVLVARHPIIDKYDLSSLRVLFSGAAPLGEGLTRAVIERLSAKRTNGAKFHVLQGYGLTETSPTTHLQPESGAHKYGSIGVLLPNLEARLVDGDGEGNIDSEDGQPGELWIRGPTIMKGYLNNVTATTDAITHDKWFKTGDIAIRDKEGYYYIVDRRKELIKYKGFQVPPAELEAILLTHPDIADTAVIGVDSAKQATELPRAYVVHARPDELKTEAQKEAFSQSVKDWIQTKVARHKFLRGGVVVIDVVPKSAAGKILRRELRERAKGELAGRDPGDEPIKAKL